MALGHGGAKLDKDGVRGVRDFSPRVIRDKRYKVWVSANKKIIRLYDLQEDPWEEINRITNPEYKPILKKFQAVIGSLPDKDARPLYEPRAANPWDRNAKGKNHYQWKQGAITVNPNRLNMVINPQR